LRWREKGVWSPPPRFAVRRRRDFGDFCFGVKAGFFERAWKATVLPAASPVAENS
jgi:hypothetical protein